MMLSLGDVVVGGDGGGDSGDDENDHGGEMSLDVNFTILSVVMIDCSLFHND